MELAAASALILVLSGDESFSRERHEYPEGVQIGSSSTLRLEWSGAFYSEGSETNSRSLAVLARILICHLQRANT